MTAAYVRSASSNVAGTSHTVVLGTVAAGNCIIVGIRSSGTTNNLTSVADSQGNTYTSQFGGLGGFSNGVRRLWCWVAENCAAGATTVTVTTSSSSTMQTICAEYTAVPTSSVVDALVTGESFTTTTTPATTSLTTSEANECVIGFIQTDTAPPSIASGGGETERQEQSTTIQLQDEVSGAAGSYDSQWTLGATSAGSCWALALKSAAAGATIQRLQHTEHAFWWF